MNELIIASLTFAMMFFVLGYLSATAPIANAILCWIVAIISSLVALVTWIRKCFYDHLRIK